MLRTRFRSYGLQIHKNL